MLLVHGGFNDGATAWSAQVETLGASHRLLFVDRCGHGRSPREPRPYSIEGDALDVLAVADRAGAGKFHLVGHSYGGLVAIELAALAPDRLLSLHLVEPPYLALLPNDPDVQALSDGVRRILSRGCQQSPEEIASKFFRLLAGSAGLDRVRESSGWPAVVREAERILDEQFAGDYPPERLGHLTLDVPVQVYTGDRSNPAQRKVARRLSQLLQNARIVEIPTATHFVQARAEEFNSQLLSVTRST